MTAIELIFPNNIASGYIDAAMHNISGWVSSTIFEIAEVFFSSSSNGYIKAEYGILRNDVALSKTTHINSAHSGFSCNLPHLFYNTQIVINLKLSNGEILTSLPLILNSKTLGKVVRGELLSRILTQNSVLEISPFSNPLISGENVHYFDVLSADELKSRASLLKQGYNPNTVPETIHYVSKNGDLSIITNKYDFVVSAHVIEHTTDIVQHLICVENILKHGGQYIVLIPDKRFMFDHFKPETNIADILDAYYINSKRPSLKTIILQSTFSTHNDMVEHWAGNHGKTPSDIELLIKQAVKAYQEVDSYLDVHNWYFTCSSFIACAKLLKNLEYISMTITESYDTQLNSSEFFIVFSKH